jgi:protoporphyrinogen oxidase
MLSKLWHKLVPQRHGEIATEGYVENVEGELFTTRKGFSLICEAFADEYVRLGGEVRLRSSVVRVDVAGRRCRSVTYRDATGAEREEPCDWFVSTLPIDVMPGMLHPPAEPELLASSRELRFRAIVFVGLLVKRSGVLPASFMYFRDKSFNRITDLTRFKVEVRPAGATILVAEITCQPGDEAWRDEEGTARRVIAELAGDGLLTEADVLESHVFKAEHGYPIYRVGYEQHLASVLAGIARYENLFTIGRQGRFAYVNTHVAMKMGYDLARQIAQRLEPA